MAPNLPVVVRSACRGQIPALVDIENLCYDSGCWSPEDFMAHITSSKADLFVAVHRDGSPVGLICSVSYESAMQICNLAVHPAYQRRGVGSSLVSHLVCDARRKKKRSVFTIISEDDLQGQLFLRKNGFRHALTMHGYDEGDRDAYRMETIVCPTTSDGPKKQTSP